MAFTFDNDVYKTLIEQYTDFQSLRRYLESEEGGSFRVVDTDAMKDLCLIRYEKGSSNMDLPHSKWFRSVVWNTRLHRPVCVAPPKTTNAPFPYTTCLEAVQHGMVCQEQHDGVMINCFRMTGDDQLYISSRSTLYATGHFYSTTPFRRLFMDAYLNVDPLAECTNETLEQLMQWDTSMEVPDVAHNEYAVYYSFLLQHTAHRIVKRIESNRIILVQKGTVYQDGSIRVEDSPDSFRGTTPLLSLLPETDQPITEWMRQYFHHESHEFQGVVCKDAVGNRWRFRSEKYTMVKSLRGNQPGGLERYAQLYVQNLHHTYLEYYPEDALVFALQSACMSTIIECLHRVYLEVHVIKTCSKEEIMETLDKMYHPHLYSIHGLYLTQLRPVGKKVTVDVIQNYFHKQPWQRIAFLLRKTQNLYLSFIESSIDV